MGKVFKKLGSMVSKGVGAITGSNAAKKAAEDQANQMAQQNALEQERANSAARDSIQRAQAQQSTVESGLARDAAQKDADEKRKAASEQSGPSSPDVDLSGEGSETDADGRRVNTRDKFMSKRAASSGLRL